nr:ABC transporter permease [Raoultella sp. NCTC 9187]
MTSPATLLAKGRRKLNASLPLQTLLLVLMLLAMFGPLLNLLIWTVAESWFFPPQPAQPVGTEILVSGVQPL